MCDPRFKPITSTYLNYYYIYLLVISKYIYLYNKSLHISFLEFRDFYFLWFTFP